MIKPANRVIEGANLRPLTQTYTNPSKALFSDYLLTKSVETLKSEPISSITIHGGICKQRTSRIQSQP